MSIQSEIARITNKRDASFTAVANKGVTVPSGSTIDDLPSLIGAISTSSPTYSITKTLTNVTTTNDDTVVLQGNSFFADLTPANGCQIRSITVMMGGVDITSQVFTPGTGTKNITANGTYSALTDDLSGYSQVSVNVPNSYASSDEGKVVSNGALVSQTSAEYTSNDTYDTTLKNSVTINVPNSYSASDEGKVVSNGALVSQTSATYTSNNTYDTTLINSVTVNVSGGGGITPTGTYTITAPGTYDITNYASVEVDIDMWTEQTISTAGAVSQALSPFVMYHFTGAVTSLTLTLTAPSSGLAHYHFDFLSGSTAATLSLPQTVIMPDDFTIEASKRYEVDIINNYGTVVSWETS